ncbi:MAG: DUF3488 domain-containing protein [Chloracidobacterium sp.]|nr:DUF3488 domain-containing protein [Chloracidobacterium sp.]
MLPRVGGAGFGGKQGGMNTQTGFSDLVRLGGIGRIQQNNEVVMRVKLEGDSVEQGGLYFRGTALDTFDNQAWSRARTGTKEPYVRGEREFIQIDQPAGRDSLSIQTIYLEPLDTAVLFALPKAVAVQSSFPLIEKDTYGALTFRRNYERVSYKVLSDRSLPDKARLRLDNNAYGPESQNYLQLPASYDRRIFDLAYSIASKEKNRYDRAVAVEKYLQNNLGYTLEQKASGDEPVADFLFNVREGHCEYFATAMAVMLRTQGIATRIVNGFHGGEYNETSAMTVVRASNAHSWVEVYFPKENVWVPFDPTPFSYEAASASTGIVGQFNEYVEALEAIWIQYFVAFDNQEQRSLVKTLRNGLVDYQARSTLYLTHAQDILAEWWKDARGDKGMQSSLAAIGYAVAYIVGGVLGILLLVWVGQKIAKINFWRRMRNRVSLQRRDSGVEFYERMQQSLAKKGMSRQPFETPLEFAFGVGSAEVVSITEKYNRVRFGDEALSPDEADEIEDFLERLEEKETG